MGERRLSELAEKYFIEFMELEKKWQDLSHEINTDIQFQSTEEDSLDHAMLIAVDEMQDRVYMLEELKERLKNNEAAKETNAQTERDNQQVQAETRQLDGA